MQLEVNNYEKLDTLKPIDFLECIEERDIFSDNTEPEDLSILLNYRIMAFKEIDKNRNFLDFLSQFIELSNNNKLIYHFMIENLKNELKVKFSRTKSRVFYKSNFLFTRNRFN